MRFYYRILLAFFSFFVTCASYAACTTAGPFTNNCFLYESQAMAACQAILPSYNAPSSACSINTSASYVMFYWNGSQINFSFATAGSPPDCNNLPNIGGSIVAPAGGGVPEAAVGGCCYVPANAVGGSNASGQQLIIGTWEPTGETCDGTHPGLVTDSTTQPNASETTNADGSKTYCTTGTSNNVCITSNSSPSSAPASSSTSPNNATNYSSTTSHPASSSSTTTTATTTTTGASTPASGSSSGSASGGLPSTYTSTGQSTQQSVTDTPASSSSTSGKCTEAVCDVGQADGQVGALYVSSGDSVAAEFASYSAQVASTPIASVVPQFFAFTPSGTCPTWSIPGNQYWGSSGFSFAFFCQSAFLSLLQAAGFIVLATAAFRAFTIALY